jgi:hypothetical protein
MYTYNGTVTYISPIRAVDDVASYIDAKVAANGACNGKGEGAQTAPANAVPTAQEGSLSTCTTSAAASCQLVLDEYAWQATGP